MPGEAKTTDFLLSTATVMVGPAASVYSLTPAANSIGLVKNVQVGLETSFVELTQGVQAQVVASVNTQAVTRVSAEVYEFSARNLAYGAQLDGSSTSFDPLTVACTLAANHPGGTATLALTATQGTPWATDDWGVVQDTAVPDRLHVFRVLSKATDTLTLTAATAVPAGMTFTAATTVIYKVRNIQIGATATTPVYGVKMVGLMPGNGEPVTLIFPKVKITKGLNLAFQTDNFANMPFEFTPYALTASDPNYADFGSMKTWSIFKR